MTGPYVAVCGPGRATEQEAAWAEEIGRRLAEAGAVVICGGLGGVMEAAARGAAAGGGVSIGLLPGLTRRGAAPHLTASIPLGMGEARNALVARASDVLIAVAGELGTLSEIALALKMERPVVGLHTWRLSKDEAEFPDPILRATSPEEAVRLALEAAG